jgi:hypothetical protein
MADVTHISVEVSEYPKSKLYKELCAIADEQGGLTLYNIARITIQVMRLAQQFSTLKGAQKKDLVVFVIAKYVQEKVSDEQMARDLSLFIEMTLPSVIDSFVELNNGETRIKVRNCLTKFFKKCGCC